ncbi:MAG: glycosyltransferase, partial [Bacteroidota bacterium]
MAEKGLRILFAGGGTGGHLYPAIAIAEELKALRPDVDILFVGTKGRIESRVVPEKGYGLKTIWVGGWSRRLSVSTILFPFKLMVSVLQSYVIIRKFKPHVVVGTGGYVSGPVLYIASLVNIP